MPEPFKTYFNAEMISAAADHFGRVASMFPQEAFIRLATNGLDELELKARSLKITDALDQTLPADFHVATQILVDALDPRPAGLLGEVTKATQERGVTGWMVMPMADWVAKRGLEDFDRSFWALHALTQRFSAEFAIRPFLDLAPEAALTRIEPWLKDPSPHVRRLVSEGTRPRLPWGMRLNGFVADPTPILPFLTRLRDDEEEYVRRSVANNLNDIAKDHPDLIAGIAAEWGRDAPHPRARLIRHGLRSLIKAGHPGALEALGYGPPAARLSRFEVLTPDVRLGGALEFEINVQGDQDERLIIDYAIHHVKANGDLRPKVFKWAEVAMKPGGVHRARKRHKIKPITTRVYYPGLHKVDVRVNGVSLGVREFHLALE